jgi:hypothetical protein
MRVLATLLIATLALVPPGICLCRLTAALVPERQAAPQEPDCPDEDHECDCPQLKHDCTVERAASFAGPLLVASLAILDGPREISSTLPVGVPKPPCASLPADLPLYLTLRAWRI